jgi:glucose/arabinose dehydrogenase
MKKAPIYSGNKLLRPIFYLKGLLIAIIILSFAPLQKSKLPPADPDNGGLFLPGNFGALVVSEGIGPARHIAVNDNGDIYVKLTSNRGASGRGGNAALRDINNDGKADTVAYFGDYPGSGYETEMRIHNGYLYYSTGNAVYRTMLTPGKLVPEGKSEVVVSEDPGHVSHWHMTKPIAFDNKGHLYVPFGAPNDAGQDITKYGPVGIPGGHGLDPDPDLADHAGIWQFDANKTGQLQKDGVKYSSGIRSTVGLTWSPLDNTLYAVMNGIDNFHTIYPNLYTTWQAAVLPSEPMLKVTQGSNFGWPYAYYDNMLDKNMLQPGYGGDGKTVGRAAQFTKPVFGFPGHWAPMDILFYQGNQFPARYKNGAFVSLHGSTDRSPYPQAGFIVCFIPFTNGKPTGKWEVFADGFTQVDTVVNTSNAVYRPMGLATGPDGSLYITDNNKGKIWRVMYKGDKTKFGAAQLAQMEKRKSRSYIKTPDPIKDDLHLGAQLEGRILYGTYCASCHQGDGKGDNNRYPPLAGSDWVTGDKDKLIDVMLNGLQGEIKVNGNTWNGVMPAHGGYLDDHAIASIASYIRNGFGNRVSGVTSLDVDKVRKKR